MKMTATQKILAAHCGKESVAAGDMIMANLDLVLANDVTAPVAVNEYRKAGCDGIFDCERVALVMDHFTPNKDIKAAEQCKMVREFAAEKDIANFFDTGTVGVEHCLLPERGMVTAGDLIIGADSHTCTYGALGAFSTGVGSTDMAAGMAYGKAWLRVPSAMSFVLHGKPSKWVSGKDVVLYIIGKIGVDGALYKSMEFSGDGIANLTVDDRLCICNMAIEAGAKNGIFPVDDQTIAFLTAAGAKAPKATYADEDAVYDEVMEIDLAQIKPSVAFPHLPENVKTFDEIDDIKIDQVVIGSCTNGRLSDFVTAAEVLKGKHVAKGVRVLIIPTTQKIYLDAMKLGLLELFINAGCVVSAPTCGPCLGGHMGILAKGERCVATTNRNFVGRMGDPGSEVYLANPAVAAASAIAGKIAQPSDVL